MHYQHMPNQTLLTKNSGIKMYDKLYNSLNGINHFKTVISHIEMMLGLIESEYLKNGQESRNDAIEAIVQILNSHR